MASDASLTVSLIRTLTHLIITILNRTIVCLKEAIATSMKELILALSNFESSETATEAIVSLWIQMNFYPNPDGPAIHEPRKSSGRV
jgi:hypothetical protein